MKCHFFGNQYPDESLTQIYKEISIMTNCTCTVTECKHNDDHCCCKSEILVNTDSKNDCSCGCTCCASFDQKTSDSFKNSTQTPISGNQWNEYTIRQSYRMCNVSGQIIIKAHEKGASAPFIIFHEFSVLQSQSIVHKDLQAQCLHQSVWKVKMKSLGQVRSLLLL